MAKLELIKNLQQTLKEIKNARAKLDEDIELFRNNSSKGEFFSESLGEKIKEQLEGILKLQKDFSEKYSEIDENCEEEILEEIQFKTILVEKKEETENVSEIVQEIEDKSESTDIEEAEREVTTTEETEYENETVVTEERIYVSTLEL